MIVNGVWLDPITLTTSQNFDTFFANVSDWRGAYWENTQTGDVIGPYGSQPSSPGRVEYSVSGAPIPEPATIFLLNIGLAVLAVIGLKNKLGS